MFLKERTCSGQIYLTKRHFNVPHGGNNQNAVLYLWKLLLVMNRVERKKGICHLWSRGRLISPSLPVGDDWYLNLSSQKRSPGQNLGEHRLVRRSGTSSRGAVVLVFCLRMRNLPRTEVLTIFLSQNIRIGTTKQPASSMDLLVPVYSIICIHR